MKSLQDIMRGVNAPEVAAEVQRQLEYKFPSLKQGSREHAIALRALALCDDILKGPASA